jgi:Methyltransferase domain
MPIRGSPNGARHPRPQAGRERPEWVVAINRNAWSQSIGIAGRNHPVRAHMTGKNTKIGFSRLHGYPQIYFTFLSNCSHWQVQDRMVPVPLDSVNAYEVLKHHGVVADLIHIDAGHDYRSVKIDLETWWPMLREGGLLIGDDYYTEGPHWHGVRQAFDEFFGANIEHDGGKCRVRKAQPSSVASNSN